MIANTNNAYLVYSTVLDKSTSEPMVDIFIASDGMKAEGLFLAEYPNAVETLIKSELIDIGVNRVEGTLKFDLEDELYWKLWDTVGDDKILRVLRAVEGKA